MYAVTRRQFKLKLIFSWVPFMQNFFAWQLVYVELKACKTKPFIYLKDKCNFLKLLKYHTCDKLILDVDKGYFVCISFIPNVIKQFSSMFVFRTEARYPEILKSIPGLYPYICCCSLCSSVQKEIRIID